MEHSLNILRYLLAQEGLALHHPEYLAAAHHLDATQKRQVELQALLQHGNLSLSGVSAAHPVLFQLRDLHALLDAIRGEVEVCRRAGHVLFVLLALLDVRSEYADLLHFNLASAVHRRGGVSGAVFAQRQYRPGLGQRGPILLGDLVQLLGVLRLTFWGALDLVFVLHLEEDAQNSSIFVLQAQL